MLCKATKEVNAQRIAITGPAGIGKTALVNNFVHQQKNHFASIIWLPLSASDLNSAVSGNPELERFMGQAFQHKTPGKAWSSFIHFLSGFKGRNLLILDEVAEIEALNLETALQNLPANWAVIVTAIHTPAGFAGHQLPPLKKENAAALFYDHYHLEKDDIQLAPVLLHCGNIPAQVIKTAQWGQVNGFKLQEILHKLLAGKPMAADFPLTERFIAIKTYIARNMLAEALQEIENQCLDKHFSFLRNEVILKQRHFNSLQNLQTTARIAPAELNLQMNQLAYALLEIADKMEAIEHRNKIHKNTR